MINKGDKLANNKKNENQGYRANITNITLDDKNGFLYTKKTIIVYNPAFGKKFQFKITLLQSNSCDCTGHSGPSQPNFVRMRSVVSDVFHSRF